MYKSSDIARFIKTNINTVLPDFTSQYKKRDLLRMRGNFVQMLIIGVSRGGWIGISPTFYVLGPELWQDYIHETVSLSVLSSEKRWNFPPDTLLEDNFANEILQRLIEDSPISYLDQLSDESVSRGLSWLARDRQHWAADLFLAFFNMTRGAPTARTDLARAFKLFHQHSRLSTNKPLRDWEVLLQNRFNELEKRLDNSDCIALCRADSESHAKMLGLPPIVWPSEWPTSVPPWPHETTSSLVSKIGNVFRRKL